MDLGKMFSDAMGGVAAFFFGAPAEATPVVRPPQISPAAITQDWRAGVPEDAQCAVNVARNFLSPLDPNLVSISSRAQNGQFDVSLSTSRGGQTETIDFFWNTPRSAGETPMWSLQHSWDKSTMSGGELSRHTGYYEHGRVSGYLGGPVGPLFETQASRFDNTYPAGTRETKAVTPVAVPYIYNAIKSTCDLLG